MDYEIHESLEYPAAASAFKALWAALRFIYRDASLEGDTARVRRQIEGLSNYELEVLKAAARIILLMAIDETVSRA